MALMPNGVRSTKGGLSMLYGRKEKRGRKRGMEGGRKEGMKEKKKERR